MRFTVLLERRPILICKRVFFTPLRIRTGRRPSGNLTIIFFRNLSSSAIFTKHLRDSIHVIWRRKLFRIWGKLQSRMSSTYYASLLGIWSCAKSWTTKRRKCRTSSPPNSPSNTRVLKLMLWRFCVEYVSNWRLLFFLGNLPSVRWPRCTQARGGFCQISASTQRRHRRTGTSYAFFLYLLVILGTLGQFEVQFAREELNAPDRAILASWNLQNRQTYRSRRAWNRSRQAA